MANSHSEVWFYSTEVMELANICLATQPIPETTSEISVQTSWDCGAGRPGGADLSWKEEQTALGRREGDTFIDTATYMHTYTHARTHMLHTLTQLVA